MHLLLILGGPDAISKMIQELPELLTRNTEILDESDRLLREEKESDEQLKSQFKEKWTRTSSDKLTGSFNSNAQKYRTIINNARDADKVVRDKFDTHREYIELLAQGSNNMESKIPASASSMISNSPSVAKLKELCETVETLKAERQVIEAEIKVLSCKGVKDSLEVSEEVFGFDLSQPFKETELEAEDEQSSMPGNNRKRVTLLLLLLF